MGKIKKGILGGFSGKVGNVIGSSWKGISYMRSMPQNVAQTRSAAQSAQKERFARVIGFLQPITAYLRVGYNGVKEHQSAFNSAVSYVIKQAMTNESITYSKVLVSHGNLTPLTEASATKSDGKIAFAWTNNTGQGNAQATDLTMPLVYNVTKKEAVYATHGATRAEGKVDVTIPTTWSADHLEFYLGLVSDNGLYPANSLYLSGSNTDGGNGSGSGSGTGGDGKDDDPLG